MTSVGGASIKRGAPAFVAISPVNEDVAFTNPQDNVIMILDSSLKLKKVLSSTFGDSPTAFKFPSGVTYDSVGNLYIVDRWNRAIKVYDSEYKYIRSIKNVGNDVFDLVVLDDGRIVFMEDSKGVVSMINSDGSFVGNFKQGALIEYNDKEGSSIEGGSFVSPRGLAYENGKYYVIDRAYPVDGSQYKATINEFDSDMNFVKRHIMDLPENGEISETLGVYGSIAVLPNANEDTLYFYDLEQDKIIDTLLLSHEISWSGFEIEISPDKTYAIATIQKDGRLFKINLNSRKIVEEKRVVEYYAPVAA